MRDLSGHRSVPLRLAVVILTAVTAGCLKDSPSPTAASTACEFVQSTALLPVGADGGTISVLVTPSVANCAWTARSTADFIVILEGASGSGPGTVRARVDPNAGVSRSGTLVAGGLATTVLQSGPIATVIDVTAGFTGTDNWVGQSFTVPGSGAINFARFNFYNSLARPIAPGTLYILNREYLGAPQDLGPTTPGFVARSQSSVDGEYQFAADVTLTAGTRYWAYLPDRLQPVGSFQASTYESGDAYVANFATQNFRKVPASVSGGGGVPDEFTDWNFRLRGSRF